jgi:RNA polymerase sigma factor (sigma-70 family)
MAKESSGSKRKKSKNKPHIPKDEQVRLAFKAKCGDEKALQKLFEAFYDAIFGYIYGKIYNRADAEDLCNDTFKQAQKSLMECKYDPEYSFYTFLRGIAYFKILDYWGRRSEQHQETVTSPEEDEKPDITQLIPFKGDSQYMIVFRLEILRLMILCCAKPHKVVAAEFRLLLQWKPQQIVEELSDKELGVLSRMFFEEYLLTFSGGIRRETLYKYGSDQFKKIRKLTKVIYIEHEYTEKLEPYRENRVREIPLQVFYTDDPEESIYYWLLDVKHRMRNALEKGVLCREDE